MTWQVIREHPKRTIGWLTVSVLIILCLHYGMRGRKQSTDGDVANKLQNAKWQKCVRLHESHTNVTTVDEYKKFDFDPEWMDKKEYWDSSLQAHYEQVRANTTKPNLKVILVPFSHNDPGWLKTFTTYFEEDTRVILDTVITKMEQYENMTFVWAEISFLKLWWDQAPSAKRHSLKKLIRSGRFEIVTGGWVMADEASSHIYGLINQLIEGHQWLRINLNFTPTTGFSIDPFGHGSTLPYLLAASGFDGTIIQRVHFAWKQFLAKKQYDDFYWTPYWNDGTESDSRTLLTHNMPFDIYSIESSCGPHSTICKKFIFLESVNTFGITPKKQPIYITDENIQEKADLLVEQYAMAASIFPHNIALMPLGGDFEYKTNASIDLRYTNYNKLVDYVNAHPQRYNNTHMSFGLPRDYFAEIKKRYTHYPHLKGDFFVYADIFSTGSPAYWSGYYTTRPMYKMLDRELENNLRSAEILFTVALNRAKQHKDSNAIRIHEKNYEKLTLARRNLGLFQHHDAITGTAKMAVMRDYGMRLFNSIQDTLQLQEIAIEFLLHNTTEKHNFIFSETIRENFEKLPKKTPIEVDQNRSVEIILFNSLAQPRLELISLHTTSPHVKLFDYQGKEVKIQINPKWNFTGATDGDTVNFESLYILTNVFEMQFVANLPPLALVKYTLKYSTEDEKTKRQNNSIATIYSSKYKENAANALFGIKSLPSGDIQIENRLLRIMCNGSNGLLNSISYTNRSKTVECYINFSIYRSVPFRSGAYLFAPDRDNPMQDILDWRNDDEIVFMISGPLTTDIKIVYGDFLTHTIRIFKTDTALDSGIFIENEIDFSASMKTSNTDFFMRFETNIANGADPVFYSDQNGFQYLRREKIEAIGIEGNYYPITSGAFIQDEEHRLTLLTTHAQGAASLKQGFLEVMMDRRTIYDDNRGMGEGVTDSQLTNQKFWLVLEEFNADKEQRTEREYQTPSHFVNHLTNMHNYPVNIFIADDQDDVPSVAPKLIPMVPLLEIKFPCDVHLSTLRTQSEPNWPMFPSRNALFILHRQSSTCKLNDIGFACENDRGFIAESLNLAKDLPLDSVELVSLTGMKSIERIKSFDQIYIKPMDIVTLNLTFL